MLLRSYIHDQDCQTVLSWITSERIHAMWCANKIPFPLTADGLRAALEQDAKDWGGRA